jgi:hypothetical protein
MKIVHTFWTRPAKGNLTDFAAGWSGVLQHYCSWILSAWQAKETYGNISLVTDTAGAKLFLNVLKLPYDSVDTSLEQLNVPTRFWSAAKVYAYGLQKDPFVHIDGDVILWKKLPGEYLSEPIIAQSIEHVRNVSFARTYVRPLRMARQSLPNLPGCWNRHHFNALNCGIFGGNDLNAIGTFSKTVAGLFSAENDAFWEAVPADHGFAFNCTIEQWTAYAVFDELGVRIRSLFDVADTTKEGGERLGFTHVMSNKRDLPSVGEDGTMSDAAMVIDTVRNKHPKTYYRLLGWLKG